jgi:hypothetical protein
VIIVFAALFIEANLNYIIEQIDPAAYKELDDGGKSLAYKLKWFYRSQSSSSVTTEDLDQDFPGFSRIRKFRNGIAHGKNRSYSYQHDSCGKSSNASKSYS